MEFNSKLFFSALGLAFILEALPYTLFPERMRQVLQTLGEEGASGLRRMVALWGRSSALFRQTGGALWNRSTFPLPVPLERKSP